MADSGVYADASVPFSVHEPRLPKRRGTRDELGGVIELCARIADDVSTALASGVSVLVTGGNCAHAPGVLGGLQTALGPSERAGVVWLDAHGDCNTPATSLSGSLGGMPVAVVLGLAHPSWLSGARATALKPEDLILAGCRDVEAGELLIMREAGVSDLPVDDFDAFGGAVAAMASRCDAIYLHVDIDVLDAGLVPDHHSRVAGGPCVGTTLAAIEAVMRTGKVAVFAVVSTSADESDGRHSGTRAAGGVSTVSSAIELISGGLRSWRAHGAPSVGGGAR